MTMSSVLIRRLVAVALLFACAILIAWWGVWALAAHKYMNALHAMVASDRSEGYDVTYDDETNVGFPTRTEVRLTNLQWKSPEGIVFHADRLSIGSPVGAWNKFDAAFDQGAYINVPLDADGEALRLAADTGHAHIELDDDRHWRIGSLNLDGASFGRTPDYLFSAGHLNGDAQRPVQPPQDNRAAGLTLSLHADRVDVPTTVPVPFGPHMQEATLNMRVMGALPDVRRKNEIAEWNQRSGVVAFDRFDLTWGSLDMRAHGTMGFDDELQPEGAFNARIVGHEAVLKALMDNGFIAQRQAGMLNAALALFARTADGKDHAGIEIPIAVQLGGLFFGPVRIFAFPEIVWQEGASLAK